MTDITALPLPPAYFYPVFIVLLVWSVVWKGMALYKSARNEQKAWFIVFLFLNTAGILEIVYLYIFSKRREKK